jgi:hypothetical protein
VLTAVKRFPEAEREFRQALEADPQQYGSGAQLHGKMCEEALV